MTHTADNGGNRLTFLVLALLLVVVAIAVLAVATFGLPVYRWPHTPDVAADIVDWRRRCEARGEAAVLFCYALGKAQDRKSVV